METELARKLIELKNKMLNGPTGGDCYIQDYAKELGEIVESPTPTEPAGGRIILRKIGEDVDIHIETRFSFTDKEVHEILEKALNKFKEM